MGQAIQQQPPPSTEAQQLLEGLTLSEQQGRIQNAAEVYNLLESKQFQDANLLRDIADTVYKGFCDDEDTRADWLEQHTFWLSLYMQDDYAENSDPERSWGATESIPILTEACDQFQARTYKIFFPKDTFVSAIPMSKNLQTQEVLEERAERIGNHMSWQLAYQDRSYRQDKDALFLGVAVHGSFFTKTYFSPKLKRFKVDNIRPTDLVVNYNAGPIRIEDLRRKSHVINTTVGETEDMLASGFFTQAAVGSNRGTKNSYDIKVDETQGLNPGSNSIKRDREANLIEQHFYYDLGEGFRPYIAWLDLGSRKLLRFSIGYEADPQGNPTDDFNQVQYFTHYKFKENPDGFYGLGLGHSIGDLNSACNIMLRQSMDAATLANDGNMSGFISERLGLEGEEIRMVLGKFGKIPDTVGDFQNAIMMMKFPGPNAALIELMEAMDERAQRLGSTTEATTGTPDKVVQPTTYLAQIEQAMEAFSATQMRLANSLTDELQKIYKINQKYLPFAGMFIANGNPEVITRQDYADDMMVMPIFDPKFATQTQKIVRSQSIAQVVMQNPMTAQRPDVMDALTRMQLEALDAPDIDELVPEPPQPANIDDQMKENMMFMLPPGNAPPFDVFPEQDHAKHLAMMEPFIKQYGDKIPPENQQALIQHKQKHEAMLYGVENGIIPRPQRNPALAAGQGNQMGAGQVMGAVQAPQAQ